MHAGEFTNERRQARTIPRLMLAGYLGFARPPTAAAGALLQDEMLDVQLDRWQLDYLVGVVRFQRHELAVAASTGPGRKQVHLGRTEQRGTFAGVPLASPLFP